mgnify:FL=1
MKKRDSIHLLLAAAALLLATAACTKDELADGDRLPEGQYPLEIARITLGVEGGEAQPWGAPATRVSETADGTGSVFDTGDPFAVQIDDGTETATYTVQDDGTATSDAPLYWTNTTPNRTVSAWYPATDGTLDLGDQSQSLAYLLGGTGTGDYQTDVTLSFTHQLAKVRVTPSDNALGEVQSLQLYTYTQCTYEKGTVVQGSQEGWIEMKKCEYTENGNAITCWEANVVPGYEIKKLRANGTEERTLSSAITPVAGKFYNITLDYDPGYTEVSEGNYTVNNEKGLKNLAELVNNGATDINITLNTDLNLTNMEWTPIGTESRPYTGNFDGGGHTITGLKIDKSGTDYVGLIGCLGSGGKVQNVTLTNISVSGANCVGGIAGQNYGTVENCSVNGTVTGKGFTDTGGIAGSNYGTISGCSAEGTVTGSVNVGGIAGLGAPNYDTGTGSLIGSTIEGCHSTAAVSGISSVGGVLGNLGNNSFLMACYSTGNVTATITYGYAHVGGVVGINGQGTVTACYHATGEITSSVGDRIGGIAGCNDQGTFTACYWDSNLSSGTGSNNGKDDTHKVDGTDVTWQTAVAAMNTALQSAGSGWHYVLNGALPTLEEK